MKYEVDVNHPIGIAAHAAARGQKIEVVLRGFLTPDNGKFYYDMLESTQGMFLGPYIQAGGIPATISHFLVVIEAQKAQVFVNEPPLLVKMVGRRTIKAGERIFQKDVGGISAVKFVDLAIASTSAVIFYFSIGWHHGIFFDLKPLHGGSLGDIERVLGEYYDRLWFSDLYSISNELWSSIFDTGWFPFMKLIGGTFETLPDFLQRDILPAWEEGVLTEFKEDRIRDWIDSWTSIDLLREHIVFAKTAVERYAAGDFVSAISILWPRIEGTLRHLYLGPEIRPGQKKLLANVREIMEKTEVAPNSYLPGLLERYLISFYFRDFNLREDRVELGRHALAHGVTKAEDYDQRRALQGFFILDQLACYAMMGWAGEPK